MHSALIPETPQNWLCQAAGVAPCKGVGESTAKPGGALTMTRSDLVEELAARFSQLTHRDAETAVKTMLEAVGEALVRGHRIEIRGFGSFSVNHRPPRMGRNPRSGESVAIPEKRVPHFKPGKALREAVDERTAELERKAGNT